MLKEIHLAHTQGFCAGVFSAIEIVSLALEKYATPLYVRHQIVHNTWVIQDFEKRGVIFIEDLEEVPFGATVVFSAHGSPPQVFEEAKKRHLRYIDATCPLVSKIHRQAARYSDRQIPTVLIGHRGHQEMMGTSGYVNPELLYIVETEEDVESLNLDPFFDVAFITQTTLSAHDTNHIVDRLRKRFPKLIERTKDDICYATQNRQDAVVELTRQCDIIIICGSPNSSNSNRLRETAENQGKIAYLIDTPEELRMEWLNDKEKVGISSGASVPRVVVDHVVKRIQKVYPEAQVFEGQSIEKGIYFPLPKI